MADAEPFNAEKVANLTLHQLRRMDGRMTTLMEIVLRQDERLGRFERDVGEMRREMGEVRRDVGEIRSEMALLENHVITQVQRILNEVTRFEDRAMERADR